METNELRLGNWIETKECGYSEINQISSNAVRLKADTDNHLWLIEGIHSIPITEKWLLKLGFKKQEEYTWYGNGADYQPKTNKTINTDYVLNDNFFVRFQSWGYIPKGEKEFKMETTFQIFASTWYEKSTENQVYFNKINYIHQLQNLYFSLVNEELTLIK